MKSAKGKVDQYLQQGCGRCELVGTPQCKVMSWRTELQLLRDIVSQTELKEDYKWGVPCYTINGKNVVLIHAFKNYCALLFFKGALMKDPKKILIRQTENVQAGRQIRFKDVKEIEKLSKTLRQYLEDAIEIEKQGKQLELKKTEEFPVPEELKKKMAKDKAFKAAFYNLTPGRQRGYLLFFSSAKQSETRTARIEKYAQNIINGKGLQD